MPLKIGAVTIDGPKTGLIVVPRDGYDIVFKFVAVLDEDEFEKICPKPQPPRTFVTKLQQTINDVEDPIFKQQMMDWGRMKGDWYFLKSVESSKIEWQQVKLSDPTTYHLWRKELQEAGISVGEVNQIYATFAETNMITEDMLKEARDRFLASAAAALSAET